MQGRETTPSLLDASTRQLAAEDTSFCSFAQTQGLVHTGEFSSGAAGDNTHEVGAEGLCKIGHGLPNPEFSSKFDFESAVRCLNNGPLDRYMGITCGSINRIVFIGLFKKIELRKSGIHLWKNCQGQELN
jgi:hypothetical protein